MKLFRSSCILRKLVLSEMSHTLHTSFSVNGWL